MLRFDTKSRNVELRRLPLLRDVSVNSIAAECDVLWFGTTRYWECAGEPFVHGLVRYDWGTGELTTWEGSDDEPIGFVINDIHLTPEAVWVATGRANAVAVVPQILGEASVSVLAPLIERHEPGTSVDLRTLAAVYGLELATHRRVDPDGRVDTLPDSSAQLWYAETASFDRFMDYRASSWGRGEEDAGVNLWKARLAAMK